MCRTGLRARGAGLEREVSEDDADGVARGGVDVLAAVQVVGVAIAPSRADAAEAARVGAAAAAARAVNRRSSLVVTQRAGLVREHAPIVEADALVAGLRRVGRQRVA